MNVQENPENGSPNISESELADLKFKVTLLANEAGMGKSTIMTNIARSFRERCATEWILRTDLNDCTSSRTSQHSLCQIKFNRLDTPKCIEFLSKMVFRGKTANSLQRELFKVCLEKSKKIHPKNHQLFF